MIRSIIRNGQARINVLEADLAHARTRARAARRDAWRAALLNAASPEGLTLGFTAGLAWGVAWRRPLAATGRPRTFARLLGSLARHAAAGAFSNWLLQRAEDAGPGAPEDENAAVP